MRRACASKRHVMCPVHGHQKLRIPPQNLSTSTQTFAVPAAAPFLLKMRGLPPFSRFTNYLELTAVVASYCFVPAEVDE